MQPQPAASSPQHVATASTAAGGVPLPFNTIAVSDNQSQGDAGHARVADLARGDRRLDRADGARARLRRARLHRRLRQDRSRRADGARAASTSPRSSSTAARCAPGTWASGALTIQDVWEAVGAEERGLLTRAELDELERLACPGPGTCAGHFTANTMAVALDCLGIAVLGDGLIPADDLETKGDGRARAPARWPASLPPHGAHVPRSARAAERDGGNRRHRRLDERPPAPARDRREARRRADARRARGRRRAHAGDREPRSRRAATSPRTSTAPAARRRCARARARRARRRRRPDRRRRERSPTRRADAPAPDGEVVFARRRRRSRRAARCTCCAATSLPTAAW